jgi:hypothetical protein
LRIDRRKLVSFDVDMVRGAGARVLGVVTAARAP